MIVSNVIALMETSRGFPFEYVSRERIINMLMHNEGDVRHIYIYLYLYIFIFIYVYIDICIVMLPSDLQSHGVLSSARFPPATVAEAPKDPKP